MLVSFDEQITIETALFVVSEMRIEVFPVVYSRVPALALVQACRSKRPVA